MESFQIKTPDTTTGETSAQLERIKHKYGFVPNLIGTFANNPLTLEAYMQLEQHWERSRFTVNEQNIVLLAASVENSCPYCTAGYTNALKHLNVSDSIIRAIDGRQPIDDPKLNALVSLTRDIVASRGFPHQAGVEEFLNVGYGNGQLIELLMGIALETMSNYLDHMFHISIDESYKNH